MPKTRVTITIDEAVLEQVDVLRRANVNDVRSVSSTVNTLLREALRARWKLRVTSGETAYTIKGATDDESI